MGIAAEVATQVSQNPELVTNNPIYNYLLLIAGVVAAAFAIGVPVRNYLRQDKRESGVDQVADAMSGAGSVLYNHLAEQITQYRTIAETASQERNALIERVARLEEKASFFEETKQSFERLKARLEDKNQKLGEMEETIRTLLAQAALEREKFLSIIQAKDHEITNRDERTLSTETRLQELELRLVRDEAQMGTFICPFSQKPKERIIDVATRNQSNTDTEGNLDD